MHTYIEILKGRYFKKKEVDDVKCWAENTITDYLMQKGQVGILLLIANATVH